jgi:hypothetical protein
MALFGIMPMILEMTFEVLVLNHLVVLLVNPRKYPGSVGGLPPGSGGG